MRRVVFICLAMLAAAPAAQAARPQLGARLVSCTTGADPASRAATFVGAMPTAPGARRLGMRFLLYERRAGQEEFHRLTAPNWGVWERSDPGRPGFVFEKRVERLLAPASYRAVVHFRWYDADGDVLRHAKRTTRVCRQPDPRPNIVLAGFEGRRVAEGFAYFVTVLNAGVQAAPTFLVTLSVNGEPQAPVTVGPLAAGTSEIARIDAPRCAPGSTIRLSLDTDDAVDESREGDNALTRPCPFERR